MSVVSVLKGIGAQITPFDSGSTYSTYNNGLSAKQPTVAKPKTVATPSYQSSNTSSGVDTSAYDKQLATSNAAIAALQAQIAAQPKLPTFNTTQGYATAQQNAQNLVDPVYVQKLQAALAPIQLGITQTQNQTATDKASIQTQLQQSLADNATAQQRAQEDQQTSLGQIGQNETNYQQDEGTQFDQARQALLGNIANSGLTTSGLGQQQDTNAIATRNQASNEQEQQFQGGRDAANTLATRTFQDLSTSSNRANTGATAASAQKDTDLQNYIDNANLQKDAVTTQNEVDREGAIASATQDQYSQQIRSYIQNLQDTNARPQDVQFAIQLLGAGNG